MNTVDWTHCYSVSETVSDLAIILLSTVRRWITPGWDSLITLVVWVSVRNSLPYDRCYFCSFFLWANLLPSSYSSPFFCSPGQKVEVKTFPSGCGWISPILPCSCQKIQIHPKLVSLCLTNLTHQSSVPTSYLHFLLALWLFTPLLFEFCCQVQKPSHDWYSQLGAQSLADLSVSFPVVSSTVAWGRAHHCSRS